MHHRIATLWTLTGLALALCLVGASPALAQAQKEKVCETVDLTGEPLSSPCLASEIVLTRGEISACVQSVIDPQDRAHEKVSVHGHGEGFDAEGNKYVFHLELPAHGNESIDLTGAGNATGGTTLHLIGQGAAPDVKCHAVLHVTRNANDEITVEFEKIGEGCECADEPPDGGAPGLAPSAASNMAPESRSLACRPAGGS
jgi:hypothetical protein